MYGQLGNTIFDGYKSFISFSQEEEAMLVEHALIGRKPRLEGAGLGLRTLSLSLFLHQEFCQVETEIAKLRTSKDTFEILTLVWGNGKVEGQFVIKQLNNDKIQQDDQGNTYAATVDVILKESVNDNALDQKQQAAQKNAFALGDKQATTKSKRINPASCQKQVSNALANIRSNGGNIDSTMRGYTGQQFKAITISTNCSSIIGSCASIIAATNTDGSCVFNNTAIQSAANNVRAEAQQMHDDVLNTSTPVPTVSDDNTLLQSGIAALLKVSSSLVQGSILRSPGQTPGLPSFISQSDVFGS